MRPASELTAHRSVQRLRAVLVLFAVAGFPTATVGEPTWELPTTPVLTCIEECAVQHPGLGDDYDACVAECYEE